MKWIFLIAGLSLCFTISNWRLQLPEKNWTEIDQEVQQLMDRFHAAGVAIAVVENGELTFSKGYGYRDY